MRAFGNQHLVVKDFKKVSVSRMMVERLNYSTHRYRDITNEFSDELKTMFVLLNCLRCRGLIAALVLTMVIDQVGEMEGGIWYMKHIYERNKESLKSI
jgi:hypothetical protein